MDIILFNLSILLIVPFISNSYIKQGGKTDEGISRLPESILDFAAYLCKLINLMHSFFSHMLWKQKIYVTIHRVILKIPGDNWYNILVWFMACNKNSVNIVCYHYSELQKYYMMELKFEFSGVFCWFCLLLF